MIIIVSAGLILLVIALSSVDLIVSSFTPGELNEMGINRDLRSEK